uniref:Secreted protein n=1 Tax=Rhipicephalus microplus TaxID=6941 RepID=A0A6M2D9E3_RHIMP
MSQALISWQGRTCSPLLHLLIGHLALPLPVALACLVSPCGKKALVSVIYVHQPDSRVRYLPGSSVKQFVAKQAKDVILVGKKREIGITTSLDTVFFLATFEDFSWTIQHQQVLLVCQ